MNTGLVPYSYTLSYINDKFVILNDIKYLYWKFSFYRICTTQIFCFNANKFFVLIKCFNRDYAQCPRLEFSKQH
ncbi:hypothetical protein V1477_005596 [Vespula maculifrons]|uniref:Uncharacterized protein n=1 Tax=Vespula maculifrons TaxID=7453 RepID=A0ABD2CQF3_VESMC